MQTVLITGANGFVGKTLARKLAGRATVIATGSGLSRFAETDGAICYESLDITDTHAVMKLFHSVRPDVVVHCAAISKPDLCEQDRTLANRVNVDATTTLLVCASISKAHFIFLSTDFVFDGEKGMYSEDDPVKPVNFYGRTKKIAEERVAGYSAPWSIVRTVLVYGRPEANRGNLLTLVADKLRAGESLRIFNDQVRTPTYVGDLVNGIISIIDKRAHGIFHISGADVRTPYQMAVETANYLGLDAQLVTPITAADLKEPAKRPQKTGFNIDKARKELGFAPVSFAKGLALTFAREKER